MEREEENHENSYSVKIIEVCMVAPAPSSTPPSSPDSLPLTFFDLLLLRNPPIPHVYLYETESSFIFIISKLKHSLSLILRHYLPVAGNLIWPQHSHKPVLKFVEGDAVSLTVAEAENVAVFHHLSSDGFREAALYQPLLPQLPASHVIAFQITRFQNKGFCIGMTIHRGVFDGRALNLFIKSWARICNLLVTEPGASSSSIDLIMTKSMPFYERMTINDNMSGHEFDLEAIYSNAWLNMEGPNNRSLNLWSYKTQPRDLIRCTLELSDQNLKKLKKWVLNKLEKKKHNSLHLPSFTLACAYLWVCVAKSESLRDQTKLFFAFPADARYRLQPPLPANYFGSCSVIRCFSVERNELLGANGIIVATEAISEAIRSLERGVLEGLENMVPNVNSLNIPKQLTVIGLSQKFEVYNVDFGWGKPRKFENAVMQTGVFSLTQSRNGDGGMGIGFLQKRNEMDSFISLFAQGLEAI